ncbi:hypothetical protein GCM10023187_26120 [Nibrella viscosa]|uniref:Outer membrane protein beta-barrel domain-containing protein n=1 Tax=Nibrella viscosa TaxID=1084524 RepID=A0ABP8KHH4_9BACT
MKTTTLLLTLSFTASTLSTIAQTTEPTPAKLPVYGNISFGYGNTFFSGTLGEKETINDDRGFGRNQGNTMATWFYLAPTHWKGLGVGTGIKGFFATPNNGGNNETYLFNYYHVGVGARYYLLSKTFNKGFNLKSSFGFGQMTEKMRYNTTRVYEHQFAIGRTLLVGAGYSIPVFKNRAALILDMEYETSSRRGDVTGIGENQPFRNSHISVNVGLGF